jgi:hypothetical protein
MVDFKIGDKVKLKKDYCYYKDDIFVIIFIPITNVAILDKKYFEDFNTILITNIEKINIPDYKPRKLIKNI